MKYLQKFNESFIISDEMKREIDSLNQNIKIEDVETLFVDLIDEYIIKFIDLRKFYYIEENSYTINYDEEGKDIKRPATYLSYKIYVRVEIIDKSNIEKYKEYKDHLFIDNSDYMLDILGHRYSIFNSVIRFDRNLNKEIDTLEFTPKNVLWLKKFGKPTYGINKKYINSYRYKYSE